MRRATKGSLVVAGAGLAGLLVGWRLAERFGRRVLVIEQEPRIGGLAASLDLGGWRFDLGAHRIHPEIPQADRRLMEEILGQPLELRPRRGLIRLNGSLVPYPPTAAALMAGLGPRTCLRGAVGLIGSRLRRRSSEPDSYRSALLGRVGTGLYQDYYEPLIRKVYGRSGSELGPHPARLRLSHARPLQILLSGRARLQPTDRGQLYPIGGIGRLAAGLARRIEQAGGRIQTATRLVGWRHSDGRPREVLLEHRGRRQWSPVELLIPSLPLSVLATTARPSPPEEILTSARGLPGRALRLLFLSVPRTEIPRADTLYFPARSIPFGRVSIPERFGADPGPEPDRIGLCIELPCNLRDGWWNLDAPQAAQRIGDRLRGLGIFGPGSRVDLLGDARIPWAYPVFLRGWKSDRERVLDWMVHRAGVVPAGRGGWFSQLNLDHTSSLADELARGLLGSFAPQELLRRILHRADSMMVRD